MLSISKFVNEDEAVALANASDYGLAGAVFSADRERCVRVANRLDAGVVWSNCSQVLFDTTPFGGRAGKKSGFGHEKGLKGLEEYIATKTVVSARPGTNWRWYGDLGVWK